MLSGLLTSLGIGGVVAAAASFLGPALLAGGPLGLALAWIGAKAASRSTKAILIGGGLSILVGAAVAITVRFEHAEQAEKMLALVKAELAHERGHRAALEAMLGCAGRPIEAERELGACILAQRADALAAQAARMAQERADALAEQKRLDDATAADAAVNAAEIAAIRGAGIADDGPVPKVLRDEWARERARRGIK